MFRRGRQRAIWTTEPYGYDTSEILELCARRGLGAALHPRAESSYYPGGTHLIAVMTAGELEAYLAREPNAVPLQLVH